MPVQQNIAESQSEKPNFTGADLSKMRQNQKSAQEIVDELSDKLNKKVSQRVRARQIVNHCQNLTAHTEEIMRDVWSEVKTDLETCSLEQIETNYKNPLLKIYQIGTKLADAHSNEGKTHVSSTTIEKNQTETDSLSDNVIPFNKNKSWMLLEYIRQYVSKLPAKDQEIIQLYKNGIPVREIAVRLNIPLQNAHRCIWQVVREIKSKTPTS